MKTTLRQRLLLISFIILAGIGFMGYIVFKSNKKLLEAEKWVRHTEQVIYQAGNILLLAKDIETASRGFILTKDSSFLQPIFGAEKTTFLNIGQLRQLVKDNPAQQQRIDSLNLYMHRRLDFSFQTIQLRNNQGIASAIASISTKQGKNYTDRINQLIQVIQEEEGRLLKQRMQMNEEKATSFNRLILIIFILLLVFTILLLITILNFLHLNEEKAKRAAELIIANKELTFQNEEKEKRAAELIIANRELAFQNEEKEKRAAELIIANRELAFQNEEKEKRAAESSIANKELTFQNEEKEKKAAELIIANRELAFQNTEKEKRAAELIIANRELIFQNKEKENRAAELGIANKELDFQNNEKEKKAAELIIANIELAFQNKEKEKRAAELLIANSDLKKTGDYLNEYILGLEEMMFMTSHKVRVPVANILGLSNLLDQSMNSPEKLKQLINYIKQSALLLDTFTKEMTKYMADLEKKGKNKIKV